MSVKSLLNSGVKPWANLDIYDSNNRGVPLSAKAATAINATGAITGANVIGRIITSTTASAVTATFANGQALALYQLMGNPPVNSSFDCTFVNKGGSNAFTIASSDSNLVVTNIANSAAIAANSARVLSFVVTTASDTVPVITIYG